MIAVTPKSPMDSRVQELQSIYNAGDAAGHLRMCFILLIRIFLIKIIKLKTNRRV